MLVNFSGLSRDFVDGGGIMVFYLKRRDVVLGISNTFFRSVGRRVVNILGRETFFLASA